MKKVYLTDEQIDLLFGDSPFTARRTMDSRRCEVVQNTDPEWREVIPNDGWVHHGYFETLEEAEIVANRLHARWVLGGGR